MAVDMFFKIGDIKGESGDAKHKEEIDVLSWSWGSTNSGTSHTGSGGGAGKVNVQDLSFTKYVDASSNALLKAVCTGKHYADATLTVRKAGGTQVEYVTIKLEEVLVTSIQTGGTGHDERLTENITLNFAKFMYKYQPQDAKGAKLGGTKDFGYDIKANKPL